MAVLTAASEIRENNGSLTLHQYKFAAVGTGGDTFASGLGANVVGYWANVSSGNVPTVTLSIDTGSSSGTVATMSFNGVNVAESSGSFTIYSNGITSPVTLNVWART